MRPNKRGVEPSDVIIDVGSYKFDFGHHLLTTVSKIIR